MSGSAKYVWKPISIRPNNWSDREGVGWVRAVQFEENRQRILGALLFEECLRLRQHRVIAVDRTNKARKDQSKRRRAHQVSQQRP